MARHIICGQAGSGTRQDPFRPAVVDTFPPGTGWAACQRVVDGVPMPEFLVVASDPAVYDALAAGGLMGTLDGTQVNTATESVSEADMQMLREWTGAADAVWPYAGGSTTGGGPDVA